MKKKLLLISLIAMLLSLYTGNSLAYFTTSRIATNVITMGNVEIELIETGADGQPFEDVLGVVPGEKVTKIVTVKNIGESACWVRIGVDKMIQMSDEENVPDLSLVKLDLNTEQWVESEGFYCYKTKLESGETTVPLFTTVTFDETMDNKYMASAAIITVNAQAVQSANNGSTVLEAKGWPEAK